MTIVVGVLLGIGLVSLIGGGLAAAFWFDRKRSIAVESEPERFPDGSVEQEERREWREHHDMS
ncbi:hypothetical protein F0U44_12575 [Nocardioides humilatus]|uniref:Uncharacterized protein n=1 Tax=Nocardioides humilatus TaxID=2607660 RepID=A0A5B1LFZ8_9ACTN|nr:hypothetical protein [Nocardioides humilatus]KAA1419274.1 hypothetical protein F0U44_12575 [Nocardioides humilatus]